MTTSKTRRPLTYVSALCVAGLTFVSVAHAALVGIGKSDVSFRAVGPGGLKIDGSGSSLTTKESGGVITLEAPLTALKTGISLRDDHLKKAINANKHPKAVMEVKRSALKFPDDKKSLEGSATGDFTLNGTKKPLKFSYKVSRTGSDYHVQGLATVDITKFNLEKPCYLGVCVDKDVKVKVKFKVREK